uniref:Mucin-like domain-containing protein n=1 Tax=Anopheles christyi TaxID=43041 RepID=A0A182JYS3_9DIPT
MAVKLVASLLLLTVAVLASKDATSKPVDGVASTPKTQSPSAPSKAPVTVTKKASSHGKREVASYGLPHQTPNRYSFGHSQSLPEFYAPAPSSHGGYSYSIPQHSSFPSLHGPASFGGHKLYYGPAPSLSSFKYSPASSHAFFAPSLGHSHPSFGGFGEPSHFKYGTFGSKDLSELLKQLHSVGPLTIKAIPSSYAYGSFPEHETGHVASPSVVLDSSAFHLKPMPLKFHQELATSFTHGSKLPHAAPLTAPAVGPTSTSSTYGHVAHSLGYEPSYANGVKGLRHYSTPNVPANDLYSGNKYISTLNLHQPTTATMVSPLHTSVHSTVGGGGTGGHQKPFKPSTYLGSTHETISAPSTSHTGAYLAPSLQYLPPVGKGSSFPHKFSYDSPAKHGYLPPGPPSTNAYLPPPKPGHSYLPPLSSGASSNYIPLSSSSAPSSQSGSHEDTVRKPSVQHHHHGGEHSSESLEYSGATAAVAPTPSAVTSSHHWKH